MALKKDIQVRNYSEISDRFEIAQDNESPSPDQLNWQGTFRDRIEELAQRVGYVVEDGREKDLALMHLEEALMWMGKAIFKKES